MHNTQLEKIDTPSLIDFGSQIMGMGGNVLKDSMANQNECIKTNMAGFCQAIRLQKEISESTLSSDDKEIINKKIDDSMQLFKKDIKSCMISRSIITWVTVGLFGIFTVASIIKSVDKGNAVVES